MLDKYRQNLSNTLITYFLSKTACGQLTKHCGMDIKPSITQQNPMDLEDQENELIVLESILDKDQFVYNRVSDVLPSGQVQVYQRADLYLRKITEIYI